MNSNSVVIIDGAIVRCAFLFVSNKSKQRRFLKQLCAYNAHMAKGFTKWFFLIFIRFSYLRVRLLFTQGGKC